VSNILPCVESRHAAFQVHKTGRLQLAVHHLQWFLVINELTLAEYVKQSKIMKLKSLTLTYELS